MRLFALSVLFAVTLVAIMSPHSDTRAQSTSDPNVCFKTCIETYGASKKQACALQCGFGKGATSGGQGRDCGSIYKKCLAQCGGNSSCKNQCRKQRTQCF
ncbi:hypothetical protein L2D14_07605 [Thalassospiraceae bacterium LMO-JJ14]|nr:hypothetical protein L2D14_07605 [Thalassospiraceae bacterium LMO-JJ14]